MCRYMPYAYIKLRTIVRQQDPAFCNLLNNVRLGKLTESNIDDLKTKIVTENKNYYSEVVKKACELQKTMKTLCLFPTVLKVQKFNKAMNKQLNIKTIKFNAIDSNRGKII